MDFEGRAAVIKAFAKGMKELGHTGFLQPKEIVEIMNDPRLHAMGKKGTGKIAASYIAPIADLTVQNIGPETEGFNNGFPFAAMSANPENVTYVLYENSSDADVIYDPSLSRKLDEVRAKRGRGEELTKEEENLRPFGSDQQQASIGRTGKGMLKSRRLGGRIQHSGNSQWEKSTATPYGEQLAYFTRRLQDKFSDVMLLQQDIEEFRGLKFLRIKTLKCPSICTTVRCGRTWRSWRSACRILVLHSRLQATPSRSSQI